MQVYKEHTVYSWWFVQLVISSEMFVSLQLKRDRILRYTTVFYLQRFAEVILKFVFVYYYLLRTGLTLERRNICIVYKDSVLSAQATVFTAFIQN